MTIKQKILEEFDKEFRIYNNCGDRDIDRKKKIQSFLSSAIDLIEKETREQVLKEVRDGMKPERKIIGNDPYNTTDAMNDAYNEARKEDKDLVDKLMRKLR